MMRITDLTPDLARYDASADHEAVLLGEDASCGYKGVIAIHSTTLGPAVGGTRMWRYANDGNAVVDALRLSRGMTYKNAFADLAFGGGKAVIMLPEGRVDRREILRAHGRFVNTFEGRYITAEDVGTSAQDMDVVGLETVWVAGRALPGDDPSPFTARGTVRAVQATARHLWPDASLAGRTAAVQGIGNVGWSVCEQLAELGVRLVVCDVDATRASRAHEHFSATVVKPDELFDVACDLFVPCALGGILNEGTIPRLRAVGIAGAANNQLLRDDDADRLARHRIAYAPDFVVNAGGVIYGVSRAMGWSKEELQARIDGIFDSVARVFELAAARGTTTLVAAEGIARRRLAAER